MKKLSKVFYIINAKIGRMSQSTEAFSFVVLINAAEAYESSVELHFDRFLDDESFKSVWPFL